MFYICKTTSKKIKIQMKTKNYIFLSVVSLVGLACTTTTESDTVESPSKKYTLTAFEPSASFPDAKINQYTYENGIFSYEVENYTLGEQTPDANLKMCANSGSGQHIHLIVDTLPYIAKYETEFEQEIKSGDHYILSFLSRSYHESIKSPDAFKAEKVTVSDNGSYVTREDIAEPILFYSRPKGTYVGEQQTNKVMLDFYLLNTNLGDNLKVEATINGESHIIDVWQPYYIEGLPIGDNTITLTLIDGEGKVVDTPLNPVTRTFTLKEDPAESN
jgi:hypothetical protein